MAGVETAPVDVVESGPLDDAPALETMAEDPGDALAEPTREAKVEASAPPLEGRRFRAASDASLPYHFKHRPTLLTRLKSIGNKAKDLASGRESPPPGSPSFPSRRASMSCRVRVPPVPIEDEP